MPTCEGVAFESIRGVNLSARPQKGKLEIGNGEDFPAVAQRRPEQRVEPGFFISALKGQFVRFLKEIRGWAVLVETNERTAKSSDPAARPISIDCQLLTVTSRQPSPA
jgi:hypothetical protein